MKDKQFQSAGPLPGIPLISPLLHVISMTGLVFLRSSFGYAFLSPKSIFLACIWALGLFSYYAWHEPGAWPIWKGVVLFGGSSALLYILHLLKAFGRELAKTGKHDYYSGKSHLMRLAGLFRTEIRRKLESAVHLWLEPTLVLIASAFAASSGIPKLPSCLTFLALSLWAKEAINYWYRLRHLKKQTDVFSDAEEGLDHYPGNQPEAPVNAGGRRSRQKRARIEPHPNNAAQSADRYAEILRLLPPYTVEQAETNYRALMRNYHPDVGGADSEASRRAADLKEALEYFREQARADVT